MADAYLHYVIDQRVAKHPVQVNAFILQNVLQKNKRHTIITIYISFKTLKERLLSFSAQTSVVVFLKRHNGKYSLWD